MNKESILKELMYLKRFVKASGGLGSVLLENSNKTLKITATDLEVLVSTELSSGDEAVYTTTEKLDTLLNRCRAKDSWHISPYFDLLKDISTFSILNFPDVSIATLALENTGEIDRGKITRCLADVLKANRLKRVGYFSSGKDIKFVAEGSDLWLKTASSPRMGSHQCFNFPINAVKPVKKFRGGRVSIWESDAYVKFVSGSLQTCRRSVTFKKTKVNFENPNLDIISTLIKDKNEFLGQLDFNVCTYLYDVAPVQYKVLKPLVRKFYDESFKFIVCTEGIYMYDNYKSFLWYM